MKIRRQERAKMKSEILKILTRSQVGIPSEVIAEGEESIRRWIEQAVDEHIDRFEIKRKNGKDNPNDVKLDIPSFLRDRIRKKRM